MIIYLDFILPFLGGHGGEDYTDSEKTNFDGKAFGQLAQQRPAQQQQGLRSRGKFSIKRCDSKERDVAKLFFGHIRSEM